MLHNSRKIAAVDGVVFASALLVNVASAPLITPLAARVPGGPSLWDSTHIKKQLMGGPPGTARCSVCRRRAGCVQTQWSNTLCKNVTDATLCGAASSTRLTIYPVLPHCLQNPFAQQTTSCILPLQACS